MQLSRYKRSKLACNAQMANRQLKYFCALNKACRSLLETAVDKLGLSARAYQRILKTARTIADLDQKEGITELHIGEAIQYRAFGPPK